MSEGNENDLPKRPMPWETGASGPGSGEPSGTGPAPADPSPPAATPPPADDGTSVSPTADANPTEVVPTPGPAPIEPPPPPTPEAAPPATAGLISAAPVGWNAPETTSPIVPPPDGTAPAAASGWGSPEPASRAVPGAPAFVFADTPSRAVAWLLDSLLIWIVGGIVVSLLLGAAYSGGVPSRGSDGTATAIGLIGFGLAMLLNLAYFVFFWTGGRRSTPGQRLFNIQVGQAVSGRSLGLGQAVVRWLGYGEWLILLSLVPVFAGLGGLVTIAWPLLLLLTTITSSTKQGIHDRIAGTWLVRPAGSSASGLALGCLILLVLVVILPILAFVALVFLGGQVSTVLSSVGESV